MLPKTINITSVKLFRFSVSGLTIQKPLLGDGNYLLAGVFQVDYYLRNVSAFQCFPSHCWRLLFHPKYFENSQSCLIITNETLSPSVMLGWLVFLL